MMPNIATILSHALTINRINVDECAQKKLLDYLILMQKWNRVFNLTAITEAEEIIYLHFIDSLLVAPLLQGKSCLDVGSGAGLPGIPLAICYPELSFTLLDKNHKKTRFLTQCAAELNLKNIQVAHANAEDFKTAHCFDTILSRALGSLNLFIETTQHLLCKTGIWLAMKGKYPEEELRELPITCTLQDVIRLELQGTNHLERHIVCLRKQ